MEWFNKIPHLQLIQNCKNELFAKATNQSISMATGEYIFILNNDIIVLPNCLERLLEYITNKHDIHAVVPCLLNNDLSIQRSIRGLPLIRDIFYTSVGLNLLGRRFDHWLMKYFDYSINQAVAQPMFSAVLMKKSTWTNVGNLDEQFPLFFNDVDWFYRFMKKGLICMYIQNAKATHLHSMSVKRVNPIHKIYTSTSSMFLYFKKNHKLSIFSLIFIFLICIYTFLGRLLLEIIRRNINLSKIMKL